MITSPQPYKIHFEIVDQKQDIITKELNHVLKIQTIDENTNKVIEDYTMNIPYIQNIKLLMINLYRNINQAVLYCNIKEYVNNIINNLFINSKLNEQCSCCQQPLYYKRNIDHNSSDVVIQSYCLNVDCQLLLTPYDLINYYVSIICKDDNIVKRNINDILKEYSTFVYNHINITGVKNCILKLVEFMYSIYNKIKEYYITKISVLHGDIQTYITLLDRFTSLTLKQFIMMCGLPNEFIQFYDDIIDIPLIDILSVNGECLSLSPYVNYYNDDFIRYLQNIFHSNKYFLLNYISLLNTRLKWYFRK